ncbi:hypothetical protein CEXT_513541 [Caerostris extrusa]|uniref:BTB domain-containing protein n=1 Tax=Caerostris extrusa TaxID=172846 RepID=A0AAV4U4G5_CAEEX|nr:hypothetical protein CEXT_513541 [Caerostris extrusa]
MQDPHHGEVRPRSYRLRWQITVLSNIWQPTQEFFHTELETLTRWHIFIHSVRDAKGGSRFCCTVGYDSLVPAHRQTIQARFSGIVSMDTRTLSIINQDHQFSSGDGTSSLAWNFAVPFVMPNTIHNLIFEFVFTINVRHFAIYTDHEMAYLTHLSDDLLLMMSETGYRMMSLVTAGFPEVREVHPFILYSRWRNFNKVHQITGWSVMVPISERVLHYILTFLYRGIIPTLLLESRHSTELSQVIHIYQLHILKKMLCLYLETQSRVDLYNSTTSNSTVSLKFERIDSPPVQRRQSMFPIAGMGNFVFVTVTVEDVDGIGPWLSYRVSSCLTTDLEYEICISVRKNKKKEILAHYAYNTVRGLAFTEERLVLFLGSKHIFGNFLSSDERMLLSIDLTYSVALPRYNLTDTSPIAEPNNAVSLWDLATDLWSALKSGLHADMRVIPQEPSETLKATSCNRFMFRARLKRWDNIMTAQQMSGNDIPTIHLPLNDFCVEWLLRFMYTAEARPVPHGPRMELTRFAVENDFASMLSLLNQTDFELLFGNLLRSRHD